MGRRSMGKDRTAVGGGAVGLAAAEPLILALLLLTLLGTGLLGCGRSAEGADSPTGNTAPSVSLAGHDEVPASDDLSAVKNAKFASLMLMRGGGLQTYMIAAGEPEFLRLADAVSRASAVKLTAVEDGSSLVFVLPDGALISFALDREHRLLARAGKAWRPAGDFEAVLAAVEGRTP